MRRLTRSHSEDLKPVLLYRDDLEEIERIFKEVSDDIGIRTDEFRLDAVEEVEGIGHSVISSLKFDISNPYVSLEFAPSWLRLYISRDDNESRGVFEKIKQVLSKCKRKLGWITHSHRPIFLGMCVLGLNMIEAFWFMERFFFIGAIAALVFYVILIPLTEHTRLKQHCIIYTNKKETSPSFWERNKDQLAMSVISAVLGALIFWGISVLVKR